MFKKKTKNIFINVHHFDFEDGAYCLMPKEDWLKIVKVLKQIANFIDRPAKNIYVPYNTDRKQ